MDKKIYLLFGILIVMGLAIATEINIFDNSANSVNFTFADNQNLTRNFTFYRYANITGAYTNLSGNYINFPCYQESANVSTSCGGLNTGVYGWNNYSYEDINISKAFDGNWSSYGTTYGMFGSKATLYVNYTKPSLAAGAKLQFKIGSNVFSNVSIPADCLINTTVQISIYGATNSISQSFGNVSCLNSTVWKLLWINDSGDPGFTVGRYIYEEAIIWDFNNYTQNPYISINGSKIWNYSGQFNLTNNRTADFRNVLNTALDEGNCNCAECELTGDNCTINYTIHSDTAGIIELSALNITWFEYTKPNLTVNSPNATYDSATYIPIRFYAADDWALDYCWYNVTRGASLEVANTNINCYANTTFTVSGDATYVFHMCINDTSGNQNCTSKSFLTTNYIPPSPGGGGGGGSIFNKLTQEVKTPVCDPLKAPFDIAWAAFVAKPSWATFTAAWLSFWDFGICSSTASFIPMYNYTNVSS